VPISSATRLLEFLPFCYEEHGLEARVSQCGLDGGPRSAAVLDPERRLVSLVGQRFVRAELELRVTVPLAVLTAVLPPQEHAAPPVAVIAVVRCDATRYRRSFLLPVVGDGEIVCAGRLELEREALAGSVELACWLVRTVAGAVVGARWAVDPGARLASARPWELRIDAVHSPRGEYLDIREEDFAHVGPPRFPRPDAMYQLDCEGESVTLWLNSGNARIASVLHSEGSVGRRARLRDAVFDRLYAAVWFRLFLRAAMDRVRLGESALPWQDAVLQKWLPKLYPDCLDLESQARALSQETAEGDWSSVLGRMDLLVQQENQAAHVYEMLVEGDGEP
jgi:hypothetical protein